MNLANHPYSFDADNSILLDTPAISMRSLYSLWNIITGLLPFIFRLVIMTVLAIQLNSTHSNPIIYLIMLKFVSLISIVAVTQTYLYPDWKMGNRDELSRFHKIHLAISIANEDIWGGRCWGNPKEGNSEYLSLDKIWYMCQPKGKRSINMHSYWSVQTPSIIIIMSRISLLFLLNDPYYPNRGFFIMSLHHIRLKSFTTTPLSFVNQFSNLHNREFDV